MKKMFAVLSLIVIAAMFSGCATSLTGQGFDYAGPGLILTDHYKGGFILPKAESRKIYVLGPVRCISKSSSVPGGSARDSSIKPPKRRPQRT